jgi:hypothetical protein
MIDYAKVLATYHVADKWYLDGEDYDGLVWLSKSIKPTREELDLLASQLESDLAAKEKAKVADKAALLAKLGITADEATLLLG